MRRVETAMPGKNHYIKFAHPVGEPIAQGRSPQIVKLCEPLYARPPENDSELAGKIVNKVLPRATQHPFTFFA